MIYWECPRCKYRISEQTKIFSRFDSMCPKCNKTCLLSFKFKKVCDMHERPLAKAIKYIMNLLGSKIK